MDQHETLEVKTMRLHDAVRRSLGGRCKHAGTNNAICAIDGVVSDDTANYTNCNADVYFLLFEVLS